MPLFVRTPHAHVADRRAAGPVTVAGQLKRASRYGRFNAWLAVRITGAVGTMTCAYLFGAWAVYGLPVALQPGGIGLANWFAEEFLQLVLLSVIIVGQNIQAAASDKRSEQTYLDAEAILHGQEQAEAHAAAQDRLLERIAAKVGLEGDA
jgi:hypothetical protein